MKTVLIALAATLALGGCASHPREPYPAERRDARCAMGCAHYHWDEAGQYDRLYDPVYVDEYGHGEGERGGYDYRYESERSYERGGGYDGYGYGEHRYAPPPAPSYPRPGDYDYRYDDDRYPPPPPPAF